MGIWGWLQAIAVGWFIVSVLALPFIAIAGKRIWRKPPMPPADRSNVHHIDARGGER